MALHSAILAKQRIGKPMGGELYGEEKPCVRWRFQSRADIHINAVGGIGGLHVSAPAQTSALTCVLAIPIGKRPRGKLGKNASQNVYPRDHPEPKFLDQSNHPLAAAGEEPFLTTGG